MWVIVLVLGVPVVALYNVFLSVILAPLVNKIGSRLAANRLGRILLGALCILGVLCGLSVPAFAGVALLFVLMALQTVKQWRYQAEWA